MTQLNFAWLTCVLLVFCLCFMWIWASGAAAEARKSTDDVKRIDNIIEERLALMPSSNGIDWGAMDGNGRLVATGNDLRIVIDAAIVEIDTRG